MKKGKIRSVTIGARGTGTGSDNVTYTVGDMAPRGDGTAFKVSEIKGWVDGGHTGLSIYNERGVVVVNAIDQPVTIEYDEPENGK